MKECIEVHNFGNKEQFAFKNNTHEISFVGSMEVMKIVGREQKLLFGNFTICWINYLPIQWQNELVNIHKFITNNLDKGYGATIDYDVKTISIITKTTFKKAQIISFKEQQCKLSKGFQKLSPIIKQCLHISGMLKTINNNKFHFIQKKRLEERRTAEFLNQLLFRKQKISLVEDPSQHDHFSLVFQQVTKQQTKFPLRDDLKTKYSSYLQQINKELQVFINFFKQRASKNNYNKVQIILKPDQTPAQIEVQGGISKILKIKNLKDYLGNENILITKDQRIINIKYGKLAKKCFRKNTQNKKKENSEITQKNNLMRFQRQKQLIYYLSNKKSKFKNCYLINYYFLDDNTSQYYLDWHQLSLNAYLKLYQNQLRLLEKLHIAIQILFIVIDLHKLGVVHRDLKSSNFMIDINGGQPLLKLIDMSDSIVIGNQQMLDSVKNADPKLFSTPLFCPIQTSTLHSKHHQIGIDRPQIDRWSIGILLYQIFNGSIPISYSSLTSKDILNLWPSQFLQNLSQKPKNNTKMVERIIGFLQYSLLKINQQQRMNLELTLTILLQCYRFLKKTQQNYHFYHQSNNW